MDDPELWGGGAGGGRLFGEQELDGLAVVEIGRDGREAGHLLSDAEAEGLHEQGLAGEIEVHAGELPVVVADVGLLEEDCAALVETADDAPAELNFRDDVGGEADEALMGGLDPDFAGHASEDPRFGVGWREARIGRKGEVVALRDGRGRSDGRRARLARESHEWRHGDGAGNRRVLVVEEGVGQLTEELVDAGGVFLLALVPVVLEIRVGGKVVEAIDLRLAALGSQRLAVGGDGHGYVALAGFNNLLGKVAALVVLMEGKTDGLRSGIGGQAFGNGPANQRGSIGGGRGGILGEGEHREEAGGDQKGSESTPGWVAGRPMHAD